MLEKKTFTIEKVYVPSKRAKTLDQDKVLALANDILENGQKTPIRLRADGERFVLIEPPLLPEEPASPNRLAIVLLGFLLALAGGAEQAPRRCG